MTPFELTILLHYHTSPDDYPWRDDLPLHGDTRQRFILDGVLTWNETRLGRELAIGERGKVYLDGVFALPLPNAEWTFPDCLIRSVVKGAPW